MTGIKIIRKHGIVLHLDKATRVTPRELAVLTPLVAGRDLSKLRKGRHRTYLPVMISRLRSKLKPIGLRIEELDGSYKLVG